MSSSLSVMSASLVLVATTVRADDVAPSFAKTPLVAAVDWAQANQLPLAMAAGCTDAAHEPAAMVDPWKPKTASNSLGAKAAPRPTPPTKATFSQGIFPLRPSNFFLARARISWSTSWKCKTSSTNLSSAVVTWHLTDDADHLRCESGRSGLANLWLTVGNCQMPAATTADTGFTSLASEAWRNIAGGKAKHWFERKTFLQWILSSSPLCMYQIVIISFKHFRNDARCSLIHFALSTHTIHQSSPSTWEVPPIAGCRNPTYEPLPNWHDNYFAA